jgi:phosphinothricin acetyltransferase
MRSVRVRDARSADLAAIDEIYNPYVLRSTCTYQREPGTTREREAWFEAHGGPHPVVVAERDATVVGWGSLSVFRERWGYRHTVEDTVYVREGLHHQGIGRAILEDLIVRARALGHHAVIAGISADQAASIALHAQAGFVEAGRLREVGHKLDRWLDVVFLQLLL